MPTHASPVEPVLRAALALGLDEPPAADTLRLAEFVACSFGPSCQALIHYGSHAHGSGATDESARDFFVIVNDYSTAYRSLAETLPQHFSAGLAALLNRILPPNVLSVTEPSCVPRLTAKCAVMSLGDLTRACAPDARDLWARARLFQQVQLVWARESRSREAVVSALIEARAGTFHWGRAVMPAHFDAESYCRALLATAYAAEIRPEDRGRLDALIAAQRHVLVPMTEAVLTGLVARGELSRNADGYHDLRPPGAARRLTLRLYLARSKARATLRWFKYVALYDGWLEYVMRKVERRSGMSFELTPRERRWPLLFLWPRLLWFLNARARRGR